MSGAVTLSAIAGKLRFLEITCSRCDRYGRLSIARLVREHGAEAALPALRSVIAADCPRMQADNYVDVCGVRFPQLSRL